MAKKKINNEIFKTLIENYDIKDTNDIKDMLKDLLFGTIQTMLEAEIEHELGYSKIRLLLMLETVILKILSEASTATLI